LSWWPAAAQAMQHAINLLAASTRIDCLTASFYAQKWLFLIPKELKLVCKPV
jgi:hypothetical protein